MKLAALLITAAFGTAIISGLFGMAGGLIFMGIIASFLGVAEAMVVHGMVQSVSNSARSFILRDSIRWDILGRQALGAAPVLALLSWISFSLNKDQLFIALGLLPFLLWLPKNWLAGDAQKPPHAVLCGAMVIALNLVAGVAGPALDFFYVKTSLTRLQVVATKALTMFCAHVVKIIFWGLPVLKASGLSTLPPLWILAACIPAAILGTYVGTRLLHRLSDIGFRKYTRILVTLVGAVYLARGLGLLGA